MSNLSAVVTSTTPVFILVAINGRRYEYESNTYTGYELADKFNGIAKHSVGRALAWLNKNAIGIKVMEA